MPLYMDIHKHIDGLTPEAAADAHMKDLAAQGEHDVEYLHYWVGKEDGTIFCLVRAPNKEAANRVHREAHGLVADELIEVQEGE